MMGRSRTEGVHSGGSRPLDDGEDLLALLADLYERGREHDARQRRHGDKLRNLEPETAALVSVLVRSSGRIMSATRRCCNCGGRSRAASLQSSR
jgi:hypothetical protein